MFQVNITGVFMDFFDLFSSKRRKQKKIDRFLLQALTAQSDGYKDVLTAAFGKIRKLSHTPTCDGRELTISYAKDVPLLDWPNDDCPLGSFKTISGLSVVSIRNQKHCCNRRMQCEARSTSSHTGNAGSVSAFAPPRQAVLLKNYLTRSYEDGVSRPE